MHIALLTEKYPPDTGGLAISAARLAHGLAANGHRVRVSVVASHLAPGHVQYTEESPFLHIHRLGSHPRTDDTLAAWFRLLRDQHQQQPFDLLHAYFITQAGFVAAYVGNYLGRPSVVGARGNDLDRAVFHPGKAAHILYALQHASAITANAQELLHKAQALAPGRSATLIPNGVDTRHFAPGLPDPALRQRLGVPLDVPVLGFVGEARAKKGLAPLLLAFEQVARQRPVALLLLGGVRKGEDKDLLTVFRSQHPDLLVRVVPPVAPADLPPSYHLLDVLLLPSLADGLPNALLEGMACGCAVIGSRVGGIPDALSDGQTGRLLPPGDVAALVQAINALLDNPDQRAQMGQQARAHVEQHFSLAHELQATLALYREVLQRSAV